MEAGRESGSPGELQQISQIRQPRRGTEIGLLVTHGGDDGPHLAQGRAAHLGNAVSASAARSGSECSKCRPTPAWTAMIAKE